jgi:cytosine/adenosine deaminase-related metal-dependent hydrolase
MDERPRDAGRFDDPFEQAYTTPILDADPVPESEPGTRAAPLAGLPFALRGCVITPDERIDDGFVEIHGAVITSVGPDPPAADVQVVETGGVILPGLIDLHGHPEYNVFAAWEPPKLYRNRYQWRDSPEYDVVVREPWRQMTGENTLLRSLMRYAEVRALVGGTTAIQGSSGIFQTADEALVRNVDRRIFGQHRARSVIDLGRLGDDDVERLTRQIADGDVNAVYIHLAEGTDERSRREFDELVERGLLTPATIIIHGTALTHEQLRAVREAGAKLVWSPQSNLRLYGATTPVADAIELGVPVGLGADWLPSGSPNLLAELKIAGRVLAQQGASVSAPQLVAMVTAGAGAIAGLGDHLGRLAAGRAADVLVLERHLDDPWQNVVAADPAWIELVTIGGDLSYGRPDWISSLADPADVATLEPVLAWGKPMLLDTRFSVSTPDAPPPRLADLRASLIERYPRIGPIFA